METSTAALGARSVVLLQETHWTLEGPHSGVGSSALLKWLTLLLALARGAALRAAWRRLFLTLIALWAPGG